MSWTCEYARMSGISCGCGCEYTNGVIEKIVEMARMLSDFVGIKYIVVTHFAVEGNPGFVPAVDKSDWPKTYGMSLHVHPLDWAAFEKRFPLDPEMPNPTCYGIPVIK